MFIFDAVLLPPKILKVDVHQRPGKKIFDKEVRPENLETIEHHSPECSVEDLSLSPVILFGKVCEAEMRSFEEAIPMLHSLACAHLIDKRDHRFEDIQHGMGFVASRLLGMAKSSRDLQHAKDSDLQFEKDCAVQALIDSEVNPGF